MILNIFIIATKIIQFFFNSFVRQLYWLYNLSSIKNASSIKVCFPVVIEGRGKVIFGRKSHLERKSKLLIHNSAVCNFGESTHLARKSEIRIGKESSLTVGSNFLLGNSSRMFINNKWEFGNAVKIATNCAIFSRETGHFGPLHIGDGTHIGDHTIMDICDDVNIGREVAIGPNCVIYTHDHDYSKKDVPAWKGGIITKPVKIEDGAWIGSGVTILPGITIGKRAVIAAGAVVTTDVPDETIFGGVPAKELKSN